MDIERFAAIIEDMALQHDYPGFEVRSVKFGLPQDLVKAPAKLFGQGLQHESALVRIASLRWFAEKPSATRPYARVIQERLLKDEDEWVRLEAVHTLERMGNSVVQFAPAIAALLNDSSAEVRKATAKALGKIGSKDPAVVEALRATTRDSDHEVRWKAEKALRLLGEYAGSSS